MSKFAKFSLTLFVSVFLLGTTAGASNFGFNVGLGLPYASQYGLNYVDSSNMFSVDFSYNSLSISTGLASASMTKPELNLKWHPFSGAFYLGLGLGQMTLTSEATDFTTSQTVKVEITATTMTPNMGWMWGVVDGGFFGGLDIGLQNPSGVKTTLTTALPSTNQAYIDAVKQGTDLGETAIPVMTFIRLGYLF